MPHADTSSDSALVQQMRRQLREDLRPHFVELASCSSTPELLDHPTYLRLKTKFERIFQTPEVGGFPSAAASKKDS